MSPPIPRDSTDPFVQWFRGATPYIRAHRGRTFVLCIGGDVVAASDQVALTALTHDIARLCHLGIRPVVVHGSRPQLTERLRDQGIDTPFSAGLRVTSKAALPCVLEAAGRVRIELESRLSTCLSDPGLGAGTGGRSGGGPGVGVASGNFITAQPIGVRDGVDFEHTGAVRRVDTASMHKRLDEGAVVLVSPVGYSPTGEAFNLSATAVAEATAVALGADKILFLLATHGLTDADGQRIGQLTPAQATTHLQGPEVETGAPEPDSALAVAAQAAIHAVSQGVERAHLIDQARDGALLTELFTGTGIGTLIAASPFEPARAATPDDVDAILGLIAPLQAEGILVYRTREEIIAAGDAFRVMSTDTEPVVACAACHHYPNAAAAELACLAVHPDHRGGGRGAALLDQVEAQLRADGIRELFVLTTRTADWFRERGFQTATADRIPPDRQAQINTARGAKVLVKVLASDPTG